MLISVCMLMSVCIMCKSPGKIQFMNQWINCNNACGNKSSDEHLQLINPIQDGCHNQPKFKKYLKRKLSQFYTDLKFNLVVTESDSQLEL